MRARMIEKVKPRPGYTHEAMTEESYVVRTASLNQTELHGLQVLILFDPDGASPHGVLAIDGDWPREFSAGWRGGPLLVAGRREGRLWRVQIPEVELIGQAPDRIEVLLTGSIERHRIG